MATEHSPIAAFLNVHFDDLLIQIICLIVGLLIATWFARTLHGRFAKRGHLHMSIRDGLRLGIPPIALLLVVLARSILSGFTPPTLLNLAVPLLLSLTVIQSSFYVLRRIFKPSPLLSSLEHIVSWLAWALVALHITGYLDDLIHALDAIGVPIGKQRVSLYTAALGLFTLASTLLIALWGARTIETGFIETTPLNTNLKVALTKILRVVLIIIAVLITLPIVGIDITVLSVFGGALGVGLGLGLQKIAANYVSGFTLLLDQSIRIGDVVTIGNQQGAITRIATRYTVLRALDGSESIIPNESMITSTVINHTLADRNNRVEVPIQVAYESDLEQVRDLLLAVAAEHSRIVKDPAPQIFLKNFAESGIDLALGFWINDPEEGLARLRSDINWAIWKRFKEHGIEIPYPQRVLHIRTETA